jgi:hypothetical protein
VLESLVDPARALTEEEERFCGIQSGVTVYVPVQLSRRMRPWKNVFAFRRPTARATRRSESDPLAVWSTITRIRRKRR